MWSWKQVGVDEEDKEIKAFVEEGRLDGPDPSVTGFLSYSWAPDGSTLVVPNGKYNSQSKLRACAVYKRNEWKSASPHYTILGESLLSFSSAVGFSLLSLNALI